MTKEYSFKTRNCLSALAEMCSNVHETLLDNAVAPELVYALDLSLEEMATNIIKYGYDDQLEHFIELTLKLSPDAVTLHLVDDGHEFDPTKVGHVDTNTNLAERAVGGMGIHLTRQMIDLIEYERSGQKNILHLTKRIV